MSTFIYFPVAEISSHNLPPASIIISVAEQVRLMMKVHAFVRGNMSKIFEESSEKEHKNGEDNSPGFSQFLYFLFVPTLIYRDSYRMTHSTRREMSGGPYAVKDVSRM